MYITWLGHACFRLQGKEVTLVTDPYEESIGLKLPRNLTADIVTVSHNHYDHNNVSAVKGNPFIISDPGEYEVKKVFIYGISSYHDKSRGKERGLNTIYLIKMDNLSICHLGDLGHPLTEEQLNQLESVDILMIPVGGVCTINASESLKVISQIEPRIVIPMHYKIPGLKVDIAALGKFCKEAGVSEKEKIKKLKITQKDLPQEETKIVLMEKS